jgi:hypothetical protein
MKERKCSNCENIKNINQFYKDKSQTGGYEYMCKQCKKQKRQDRLYKKYRQKIQLMTLPEKQQYLANLYLSGKRYESIAAIFECDIKIIINELKLLDMKRCCQCKLIKSYSEFTDGDTIKLDRHNRTCKVCVKKNNVQYFQKNKSRIYNQRKNSEYSKSVNTQLNIRISKGIRYSLKSGKEGKSWKELVDFTLDELKEHLELHFEKDMTWNNMNKWHIDHIIPKRAFNIISADCKDFKMCWFLLNLQPLWKEDNIKKSDKLYDGSRARDLK